MQIVLMQTHVAAQVSAGFNHTCITVKVREPLHPHIMLRKRAMVMLGSPTRTETVHYIAVQAEESLAERATP